MPSRAEVIEAARKCLGPRDACEGAGICEFGKEGPQCVIRLLAAMLALLESPDQPAQEAGPMPMERLWFCPRCRQFLRTLPGSTGVQHNCGADALHDIALTACVPVYADKIAVAALLAAARGPQ